MIINDNALNSKSQLKKSCQNVFSNKFKDKLSMVDINGFEKILNNNLNPVSISSNQTKIGFNITKSSKETSLSFFKNKANKNIKQKQDIQLPSRITYEATETKEDENKDYLRNNNKLVLNNPIKISKIDKPFNYNMKQFKILKKKRDQELLEKNCENNQQKLNNTEENGELLNKKSFFYPDLNAKNSYLNKGKKECNVKDMDKINVKKGNSPFLIKDDSKYLIKSIDEVMPFVSNQLGRSTNDYKNKVNINDIQLNKCTNEKDDKFKNNSSVNSIITPSKLDKNNIHIIKDTNSNYRKKFKVENCELNDINAENTNMKKSPFLKNSSNVMKKYNVLYSNAIPERIKDTELLNSNKNIIDVIPMTEKLNSDIYNFSFNQEKKLEKLMNKKAFVDAPYMYSNVKYENEIECFVGEKNKNKLPAIKQKDNGNLNFKPYTVRQYQDKYEKEDEINKKSLGPNIGSDEWNERNKKMSKLKDYSHSVERKFIKKKNFDKNIYKDNDNMNFIGNHSNYNVRNIGSKRSGRSKGSNNSNNSKRFDNRENISSRIDYDRNFLRNSKYNSSQHRFYELDDNLKKNMFSKYDSNGRKIAKEDNNKNFNSVLNCLGIDNEELIKDYNEEYNNKFDFNNHENNNNDFDSIDNHYIHGKDIEFGYDKLEI